MTGDSSLRAALDRAGVLAVDAVEGADHAGITVARADGSIRCLAATDVQALVLTNIARRCRQGPAFDLLAAGRSLLIADLARDSRWPEFAADALTATTVRALLAQKVVHHGDTCAVLTLYSDRPGAFGEHAIHDSSRYVAQVAQIMAAEHAPAGGRLATAAH
ncbi:GAF domain-containing protein [Mycolicibacterium sp. F2034L]|uniref:GAF domain-containing protein n=1 Tax=Mycolicibacterium sp. F2034L TaxID=2926422 RepID=UPI001FF60EE2|nr:GAF domain-containing protein [Mycolicibacterium sp. F2034L]MCK0177236.1 hypothetical protein [Mycolicibacterium sp. F2034L]